MYFLQLPNMLIIFLFLAAKSCDHYAADILFTCSMTTFVTAKSTNQPLISFEHVNHVMREVISFDSCTTRHFGLFRFNSDWTRQFFYQDFWRCILPISTPLTTVMSQCRQNYHEECEAGINKQINLELYASYVYLSMVGFVMKHSLILRRWTWTKCVLFLLKRPITSIVMMWRCQDSTSSCWNSRMKNANTLKR